MLHLASEKGRFTREKIIKRLSTKQPNLKNLQGKLTFLGFWEGKEEGFFQIMTKWTKSLMVNTFFLQFKAFGRLNANYKSFPENKYHKYHKCSQFVCCDLY